MYLMEGIVDEDCDACVAAVAAAAEWLGRGLERAPTMRMRVDDLRQAGEGRWSKHCTSCDIGNMRDERGTPSRGVHWSKRRRNSLRERYG